MGVREKVENKLCDLHLAPTICHLHTWDTDEDDDHVEKCNLEIEKANLVTTTIRALGCLV